MNSRLKFPRVRVVLPTYNRAAAILDAVTSVQDQTWSDWELIIVDDGSTDATQLVLADVILLDARIRVVEQTNSGAAAARNRGLTESGDFEFVAFIDSDDIWKPWHLQEVVDLFESHGEVGLVFTRIETLDHVGKLTQAELNFREQRMDAVYKLESSAKRSNQTQGPSILDPQRLLTALLQEDLCPYTPTVVIKRSALGPHIFPTHLCVMEDVWFWCKLASAGVTFAYLNRPHATVRYFGDNLTMVLPLDHPATLKKQQSVLQLSIDKLKFCKTRQHRLAIRREISRRSYLLGQCNCAAHRRFSAALVYLRGFWFSREWITLRGLFGLSLPEFAKREFRKIMGSVQ